MTVQPITPTIAFGTDAEREAVETAGRKLWKALEGTSTRIGGPALTKTLMEVALVATDNDVDAALRLIELNLKECTRQARALFATRAES